MLSRELSTGFPQHFSCISSNSRGPRDRCDSVCVCVWGGHMSKGGGASHQGLRLLLELLQML